jgi:UDP-glucuronate 4-epimerase
MRILVTGAAGFIGYHLCQLLVENGIEVVGIDNINDYYDVSLKYSRLLKLGITKEEIENEILVSSQHKTKSFKFIKLDIQNKTSIERIFKEFKFDAVCNLAAQAGVRYSIENPMAYIESNIIGFMNVLECCREFNINKLVYASSSSVYGNNTKIPFSTSDNVDNPISIYAATKKSNELMAHTYSHLFNIETIGLRFFTVYGPWGRPDMAFFLFTDAILNNRKIKVFNNGNLSRDFTYIDDIVAGIFETLINKAPKKYNIYNIGNSKPIKLLDFIDSLESNLEIKADKDFMDMQPGDVEKTWADISELQRDFNYNPKTDINTGISNFVDWYKSYYSIKKNK